MSTRKALLTILIAGLVAGTFDITYACIFFYARNGLTPGVIFRSVARGALGPSAFRGGVKVAILGFCFHYLIALIWAAIYYAASRLIPFLNRHPIISGLTYGLCIYLVMYGLVMRYSAIHQTAYPWQYPWGLLIPNVLIHTLGIGLPIAVITRKFAR